MPGNASSETALVLAPAGRDAAIARAILAEGAVIAEICRSPHDLLHRMADGAGFALVTEEALRDVEPRAMADVLAQQAEWSDFPFILLTSQGGGLDRNPAAARYGALLGNVTFLERPFHPTTLVSLAHSALRARRRQYEARERIETIRSTERRMALALEAGRLGAWSMDLTTRALTLSPLAKAQLGRPAAAAVTFQDLANAMHADDRGRVLAALDAVVQGATDYHADYRCVWPNGEVHWIEARGRRDGPGPGQSMSGVISDVSDSREAQHALSRSEERFRAAVEALGGVLWTNSPDGRMLGEQPGWAKLTGQTIDAYAGFGWSGAVHPDDAQPTIDAWQIAVAARSPFVFEHRVRRPDGGWGHYAVRAVPALEADGTVREWVGVHTDITAQRLAERALAALNGDLEQRVADATRELAASEARLRAIFETSYQFVGELTPDGRLIDANSTSLAAIGRTRDDVIGQYFWETPWFANDPDKAARVKAAVARARAGEASREELTLTLPQGPVSLDFSLRPVRDATGQVVAIVPEAIDMTERRRAEAHLAQSQKLETIGQLTGGVAHDFNNLLTPIVGSLELLRRKLDGDARALRWADAGLQSAHRAGALVSRLLTFARRQTLEIRPIELTGLVEGMQDLLRRSIGPTVEVQIEAAAALPPAFGDANQIELAILNLCVNARDAMPDGGVIQIALSAVPAGQHVFDRSSGPFVAIAIADTGTGMDATTMQRAIEPFYTTKGVGKGTGLGLSMVNGLVGQLGGGMTIQSALGQGTTVTLFLPVADGGAALHAASEPVTFRRPTRPARILVVDDEELVRFTSANTLRDAGYEVCEAASGGQALDMVAAGHAPDVLVTDQLMPGMKGSELAGALVARLPGLKVLVASGYSDLPELGYPRIAKPFATAELTERVRLMVEGDA